MPALNTANSINIGQLQLSQVVGGGSLVVSPYITTTGHNSSIQSTPSQLPKLNGCTSNEIGRLPGGAELNILPNGLKKQSQAASLPVTAPTATFYHANGKLTIVNGGGAAAGGNSGDLLKENITASITPTAITPLQLSANTAAAALTPIIIGGNAAVHYATGNFAQLIASTTVAATAAGTALTTPTTIAGNGKSFA